MFLYIIHIKGQLRLSIFIARIRAERTELCRM
nr:MAG TPA: hypothetical protein [Caudoviricetes sp.]